MNIENLEKMLKKDETILWSGSPVRTKWLDEDVRSSYLRRIIIGLAVTFGLIIAYTVHCLNAGLELKWGINVVILVLGSVIISDTISNWFTLKKTIYGVTNQRVLVYASETKKHELSLDNVDSLRIVQGRNGKDSLCIGSPACKLKTEKLRSAGVHAVSVSQDNGPNILYPVFYNIDDAAGAEAAIRNAIAQKMPV